MKSFSKYATSKRIISLLAKERAKCAKNGSLDRAELKGIYKEISELMPKRNQWHSVPQRIRKKHESADVRNILAINQTINADRKAVKNGAPKPEYMQKLDEFVQEIRRCVVAGEYDFGGGLDVVAKFKEDDSNGNAIYRPLCQYTSLKTKILIALASKYLTTVLDPYLHTEILAYRARRKYHGEEKVTDGSDAITRVREFLKPLNDTDEVYVAECDIQKFFDIINHRTVLNCFDNIAKRSGIPEYDNIRSVMVAYLNSYSFGRNIMSCNDDEEFWTKARKAHKGEIKGKCMFKWVDEKILEEYYEGEDYREERMHLGVPQGGALSCIIANVVLDSVDRAAGLDVPHPDKLFVRYGDDILLMHRNREACERLIEAYAEQLKRHKLVSHKFNAIGQFKSGSKLTAGYWDVKSKSTFRFSRGKGNAAEWIGFVGYEINRNGFTRLRKSTMDKRFGDINKRYHSCMLNEPKNMETYMRYSKRKVAGMTSGLKRFPALNFNKHSMYQMKSLDRYRWVKVRRLQEYFAKRHSASLAENNLPPADFVNTYLMDRNFSFFKRLKESDK